MQENRTNESYRNRESKGRTKDMRRTIMRKIAAVLAMAMVLGTVAQSTPVYAEEVSLEETLAGAQQVVTDAGVEVNKNLGEMNSDLANVNAAVSNAAVAGNTAAEAASDAEEALNKANEANSSTAAKTEAEKAQDAADTAQEAASKAAIEAANAQQALLEAKKAYDAALKAAEAAQQKVDNALANVNGVVSGAAADLSAAQDELKKAADKVTETSGNLTKAEEKLEKAEADLVDKTDDLVDAKKEQEEAEQVLDGAEIVSGAANRVVDELEDLVEGIEGKLNGAKNDLAAAEEALEAAKANESEDRAALDAALKLTAETGAFVVAAEAYAAATELGIEGLELAISAMEEAKEQAAKAMAEATAMMESIEGDKAAAEKAYATALEAYNAANTTLENAKADLRVATEQKELAENSVGDIAALEKNLAEAETEDAKKEAQDALYSAIIEFEYSAKKNSELTFAGTTTAAIGENSVELYVMTDAEGKEYFFTVADGENESYDIVEVVKKGEEVPDGGSEVVSSSSVNYSVELTDLNILDLLEMDNLQEHLQISEESIKKLLTVETDQTVNVENLSVELPSVAVTDKNANELIKEQNVFFTSGSGWDFRVVEWNSEKGQFGYYSIIGRWKSVDLKSVTATYLKADVSYDIIIREDTYTTVYSYESTEVISNVENASDLIQSKQEAYEAAVDSKDVAEKDFTAKSEAEAVASQAAIEATEKYNTAKSIYDKVEEAYDYYFGDKEANLTEVLPDWLQTLVSNELKKINPEDVEGVENLVNNQYVKKYLDKALTDAGLSTDVEVDITITEDGELIVAAKGTSMCDQHMLALAVAKGLAEEELAKAEEEVVARKEAHAEAVDALEGATKDYENAVVDLAAAALAVELKEADVAVLEAELVAAQKLLEAGEAGAVEAAKLVEKALKALETANGKVTGLETLVENAEETVRQAEEAVSEAETAKTKAETAKTEAEDALTKAEEAEAVAKRTQHELNKLKADAEKANTELLKQAEEALVAALKAAEEAEAAAKAAQEKADEAQAQADAAQARVDQLVQEEKDRYDAYINSLIGGFGGFGGGSSSSTTTEDDENDDETIIEDEEVPLASFGNADGYVVKEENEKEYVFDTEDNKVTSQFVVFEHEEETIVVFANKKGKVTKKRFIVEYADGSYKVLTKKQLKKLGLDINEVFIYWADEDGAILMDGKIRIGNIVYKFNEEGVLIKKKVKKNK